MIVALLAAAASAQEGAPQALPDGVEPSAGGPAALSGRAEQAEPELVPGRAGGSPQVPDPGPASPAAAIVAGVAYPGLGQLVVGSETKAAVVGTAQAFLVGRLVLEDRWTRHALRLYNETGSLSAYDDYSDHYDRRQTLVWWVVIVGLLSVADAYVDAHLVGFDEPMPPAVLDAVGESPSDRGGGTRLGLEIRF